MTISGEYYLLRVKERDVERLEDTTAHIQRVLSVRYSRFESRHRCKDGRVVDIEVSFVNC